MLDRVGGEDRIEGCVAERQALADASDVPRRSLEAGGAGVLAACDERGVRRIEPNDLAALAGQRLGDQAAAEPTSRTRGGRSASAWARRASRK